MTYESVNERLKAARGNKQLWESHLRECYEYALPARNTIDKYGKGQKKRNRVFDSTAEGALEDFANRMTALLVPNTTQWMKLEAGSETDPRQESQINQYLEETTKTVFKHINSSNFSSQVNEAFLDLGISTGAIVVEEGDGIQTSLNFRAVSLSELILERSSRGIIETVFREFKIPVKDILATWKTAKLSQNLKELLVKSPTTDVSIVEGVVQNEQGKWNMILMNVKEKEFILNEELDYNPYIVFRESSIPGEVYGRGREMRCLSDIKTLNRMVEDYLKGLSFQANPVFTATDDGVINPYTFDLHPGSVNPVGSNDRANPTLSAVQLSGNPQLMDFAITKYQDSIKQAMLSKPFGNIQDTPVRTATEMSIRNADVAQTSLSTSTRIQTELLERVIANCVHILKRVGKVADFKVNGKEVALKFINPASRQQNESELAAYGRFMEISAAMPPEVIAQEIKIETIPSSVWEALGLPETGKRNEQEKAKYVQAQQEQMAAQAAAQGGAV